MRRAVILGTLLLACAVLTAVYATRQASANGEGIFKPFTATLHEVRFHVNGTAGYDEDYTVAFRSDGSNVHDYHRKLQSGQVVEVKMVEDVSHMRRVTVDYATESTSTYALPSNFSAMAAKEGSSCSSTPGASSSEPPILGYEVVLVHNGHTYGNGKTNVHDLWEAPKLNCFALRRVDFASKKPGEVPPHNEVVVTKIVLGEPDNALFSIPEDFVERSPSARHAEFERRYGIHAATPTEADSVYYSAQDKLK